MAEKITIVFGGIQGEGVVSTGDTLIKALSRSGYFAYGYRTFSSRIKGGHTNYAIEISTKRVLSCSEALDVLVAFDQDSIDIHYNKLKEGGLLIYDDIILVKELQRTLTDKKITWLAAPLTKSAKAYGSTVMKNTAIIGLLGKLFQLPFSNVQGIIQQTFQKKGEEIVAKNLSVLQESYDSPLIEALEVSRYALSPSETPSTRASMIGNEALALGALAAGCRFMAAYPITPASEIMEYLTKKFTQLNGVMVQTEDEISAVTMTIGASYAGVRSMTATSGPGISLMMEGIGLAGMAEIPLVVVDAQRGGPSTGLPTKHEQSDIDCLYHGPHGEIPAIILSPYSAEECFYQAMEAFNLAEKYQCPVFLMSDLNLSLSRQTIDPLDVHRISIDRGKITEVPDHGPAGAQAYKRFRFTEDGISPRAYPGMPNHMHPLTGIEHQETGRPDESSKNRSQMMEKRMNKLNSLKVLPGVDVFGNPHSELLVLSMGSNYGIIKDAVESFNIPVAFGMIKRIKPLPVNQLTQLFQQYPKILVIENNYTGQLTNILKQEIGYHHQIHSLVRYDGLPFIHKDIRMKIEELI
ncbi:2-oxoacid:acceptor oxidoreductase subunit alpha [Geosporobacter ferrireducens]|uniref:Pyruvate ferredoxin oxidoreductase n=1 Tax=Geosporobacter ferrireducens TaxID=1424294 RepID=A0A1D8GFP1_9FIRM|nr:2-oxoacid:acceptor oxidoreductase subunit alpha [Geosporobacter ferrireducens]AOT69724.1 pyruvate ferredoxin oxidoreductase [Geosporobacter ferrireducens]MTI54567.1 2-oxoacid:acceptor oxidoreductase subunit alpha [Geosporobacter ferrireducens]